jgi:preprotein translocase subunit YajC
MNRRERLLAALIALLALMMACYFLVTSVQNTLAARQATLAGLRKQWQEQDRTLQKAARANRILSQLQQRSLPTDREQATSLYQQWLLNLVDWLGFVDPSVLVTDRRASGGYYEQVRFEVAAQATLEQLTDFLAAFYSSGDLHRIQLLTVKPIKDSRHVDILIGIEAISLPGSKRNTVGDVTSNRFTSDQLAAMEKTILDRSMFFPANKPPLFQSIANQRVAKGTALRVLAKASDPDPWDALEFSLTGDAPPGVQLQPRGSDQAELSWTPQEIGEFTIELSVSDNANPRGSDRLSLQVSVVEPPPAEEPANGRRRVVGFDDATQTFLVATVANGQQRQAWFSVRTRGELLKLSTGDAVDVGSILGKIAQIDESQVQISTSEGTLSLRVGQSLTEAVSTEPPSRQADSRL